MFQLIKRQSYHHIETSQLICFANQLTGFYKIVTLLFSELKYAIQYFNMFLYNKLVMKNLH